MPDAFETRQGKFQGRSLVLCTLIFVLSSLFIQVADQRFKYTNKALSPKFKALLSVFAPIKSFAYIACFRNTN